MAKAIAAPIVALALAGCTVVPTAAIIDIDKEDVVVAVQLGPFDIAKEEDIQRAGQAEANRGCQRYDRTANFLSGTVTHGNEYNGYTTTYRFVYTCD